ncbi:Ornithine carbamoyltransferase, catabolic [Candidatus Gugararchaeum adminiculabundum]|nr:Ornithine carbamoyltransferase, catabolic [Candidatus Gugararchaeum adminiculabundum]
MKHLLAIKDLKGEEISEFVDLAEKLKKNRGEGNGKLAGKTLGMIFEKASTRTRVSFEVAMTQLGGHAVYMDYSSSQISRGETIADTGKVLSRYLDAIMARLYKHTDLVELAKNSSVPVINGLTDIEHPCQIIGDLLIMKEKGKLQKGKTVAFVGDCANNVANSFMNACAKLGMNVRLVCPAKYPPIKEFVDDSKKYGKVEIFSDPLKGVAGADVIYTDVWVSMGFEDEEADRMKEFVPYQVNDEMMKKAAKDAIFLHCLPAHRGQEVSGSVIDGKQSVVWDQAENRLHAQKAILLKLLGKA